MSPSRSGVRRLFVCLALASASLVPMGLAPSGAAAQTVQLPIPQIQTGPRGVTITPMPGVTPAVQIPNEILGAVAGMVAPPPAASAPAPQPGWGAAAAPGWGAPPPPAPAAPAAPPPAWGPSPAPSPAPTGAPRTYGVFVGISDYPSANDLPHVADDARRMQRAFLNAGVIQPVDSVVLTDHMATRRATADAVERFSRRMRPEDTLVFFFSGHGNQVADRDGDERDGQDETIVFVDGPMLDDEVARMLQGPGREFVALDSCYSGGFANDVARLPNSVGFYASAEDQVSYVAPEYSAGGYLSYFLAQNITRNGGRAVPMWELQRDLQSDFDQSGASQRQRLTVGVSRGVNTRTALLGAPAGGAPVVVAQR